MASGVPVKLIFAVPPLHILVLPLMLAVGRALTTTVVLAVAGQVLLSVTVTV